MSDTPASHSPRSIARMSIAIPPPPCPSPSPCRASSGSYSRKKNFWHTVWRGWRVGLGRATFDVVAKNREVGMTNYHRETGHTTWRGWAWPILTFEPFEWKDKDVDAGSSHLFHASEVVLLSRDCKQDTMRRGGKSAPWTRSVGKAV